MFRSKGFWPPARRERRAYPSVVCKERATTREAKRTAARRVAPKMAWGFVAPQSQIPADMLLRRASPQAILGATKHQLYARHHTRCFGMSPPTWPHKSQIVGPLPARLGLLESIVGFQQGFKLGLHPGTPLEGRRPPRRPSLDYSDSARSLRVEGASPKSQRQTALPENPDRSPD